MNDIALKFQRPMRDYIEYFETLTPRSIRLIEKIAAPNMYFKDPFNEAHGIEAVERIFEHMFKTLETPKFKVIDYGFGQEGAGYIRWRFSYASKGKPQSFDGMSEITFNDKGQIISHIDHWDSGEGVYEKIPLLGAAIRFVKSKLAVH